MWETNTYVVDVCVFPIAGQTIFLCYCSDISLLVGLFAEVHVVDLDLDEGGRERFAQS
jgi:hypothetical protein